MRNLKCGIKIKRGQGTTMRRGFAFIINLLIAICTRATERTTYNDSIIEVVAINTPAFLNTDEALVVSDAGTNKCECVKANPVDITGVMTTNDGTLEVATAPTFVGTPLELVCSSGKAYHLDVDGVDTFLQAEISGDTGNTNTHIGFAWVYIVSGSVEIKTVGGLGIVVSSTLGVWHKLATTALTPSNTVSKLRVQARTATSEAYFVLPQWDESPFVRAEYFGADTAASASWDADINTSTTPQVLLGATWAFEGRFTPAASGLIGVVMSSFTDANNYTMVSITATLVTLRKRVSGVNHEASFAYTHVGGTEAWYQIYGSVAGIGIRASHASADITAQSFDTDADTDLAVWDSLIGWGHLDGGNVLPQEITNNGYPIARDSKESMGWS